MLIKHNTSLIIITSKCTKSFLDVDLLSRWIKNIQGVPLKIIDLRENFVSLNYHAKEVNINFRDVIDRAVLGS